MESVNGGIICECCQAGDGGDDSAVGHKRLLLCWTLRKGREREKKK
jgi:hypothetical protein